MSEESMDIAPSQINSESIITIKTKQDPNFRNHLAILARSDAQHDLKVLTDTAFKNNTKLLSAFNAGLPENADKSYHEGNAFASVFTDLNDEGGLLQKLQEVPDVTINPSTGDTLFEVGYNNNTIFTYKVVKFITKSSTNTAGMVPCTTNFGKTFFENTQLGGGGLEAGIIVDFSQHHFLERLVEGEQSDFVIHYLMSPEVVNDPAGKPNVHNKSLFGAENGVKLHSYVQTDPTSMFYTKFNEDEPNPANNFFSNYDFTLSPIKQIYTKQKAEKFITTLDIKYDNGNDKPLTDTIEDSKGENSITTVLGYINKLITQITSSNNNTINKPLIFNFNSKCQQKRGGDWFQALSCLDARNRTFTKILPEPRSQWTVPSTCPIYFVTHDRIAVAFALLNGVNVIYQDYYGRIFVFKNTQDQTVQGTGKPIEEILFEGMKTSWLDILDASLTTAIRYNQIKDDILNEYINLYDYTIQKVNDELNSFNVNNQGDFMKVIETSLRQIYCSAVQLIFIKINLIDVSA